MKLISPDSVTFCSGLFQISHRLPQYSSPSPVNSHLTDRENGLRARGVCSSDKLMFQFVSSARFSFSTLHHHEQRTFRARVSIVVFRVCVSRVAPLSPSPLSLPLAPSPCTCLHVAVLVYVVERTQVCILCEKRSHCLSLHLPTSTPLSDCSVVPTFRSSHLGAFPWQCLSSKCYRTKQNLINVCQDLKIFWSKHQIPPNRKTVSTSNISPTSSSLGAYF